MLTFNLKKEWYEKIASGEKRIECREVKPYWTKRFDKEFAVYVDLHRVTPFNYPFRTGVMDCSEEPKPCKLRLG